jgi:hypothetical protein
VLIGAMMCAVMISAAAVLAQARPAEGRWSAFDLAIPGLLGLMLNVAMIIGTIEWEYGLGDGGLLVRQNPIWVYPLVGGSLALGVSALARRLSHFPWAATLAAAAFFGIRLAVSLVLRLTDNIVPAVPPVFFLGSMLVDVIPWNRIRGTLVRDAGMSVAFTAGYAVLALPLLVGREHLPPFTAIDCVLAVLLTAGLGMLLMPVVRIFGDRLLGAGRRATLRPAR